jgi:hypothetical protein
MADTQKPTKTAEAVPTIGTDVNGVGQMLVVDIGKKQSKRRIRQLRKGYGRLFDKISATVADLKTEGAIKENVQPLVIVVRKKEARKILGW